MAIPVWFDTAHYKAQKLAQLQATDSNGAWTAPKLDSVMESAGFSGNEGWFAHFTQYGADEHCSPNATFNAAEYLTAKLAQLKATDPLWTGKSVSDVQAAFKAAGLGEWEHYHKYGMAEGLNPSNAFDELAYLDAKLVQLVSTDPTNWTGKTALDVRSAFQAAELSALEHFMLYGKAENLVAIEVPADKQVTVPSDFHVFGGQGGMPSAGFDLTRGSDNLTGTAGNDSFFAADANGFQTLNATDTLNGGAGEDTLFIGNGGGAVNFGAASIKGIETVVAAGVNGTLDVSANADVKNVTVSVNGSVNAKLAQNVTLENVVQGGSTVRFVDANGKDDAVTLKLKANNMSGLAVEGIEKLTLDVTDRNAVYGVGANPDTPMGFTNSAVKELIVTGEGSVKLAGTVGSNGTVSNLDFSANKGGVTVAMIDNTFAKVATVTGGAGDDSVSVGDGSTEKMLLTVDMGAGNDSFKVISKVHKDATFNGGDGVDTLVLDSIASADMTKDFGNHFKGFEAVTLEGNTTYVNSYFTGISEATVVASHASVGTNTVVIQDLGAVTVAGGGGTGDDHIDTILSLQVDAKAVDLTFDNGRTGLGSESGITVTTLTASGSTALTIHSEGNVNSANTITTLTGADLKNITIDGDQDLAFTLGDATKLNKIDAKALTGDLRLTLSATALEVDIFGGAGDDTFTTVAESFLTTIDGGAGQDTFDVSATDVNMAITDADNPNLTTKMVVIDGFEKGETIKFGKLTDASVIDEVSYGSDVKTTLYELASGASTTNGTIADLKWFTDDKDTYIVYNIGTAGTGSGDVIVKLTGVTDIDELTVDDFTTGAITW